MFVAVSGTFAILRVWLSYYNMRNMQATIFYIHDLQVQNDACDDPGLIVH
jgi:hypothetical protein